MTSFDLKPTVYVVGTSGRSAAESVRQAGFRAIVVDLYADRDSGEACDVLQIEKYPDSIVSQLKNVDSGIVLLAGGMENRLDLVVALGQYHRVLGPNVEQIKRFRDHEYLMWSINQSTRSGVLRFPETIRSQRDVNPEYEWLCKSYFGCGGFHIERLSNDRSATLIKDDYYFQREVAGRSVGTVFLCERSKVQLIGATAAITTAMHESLLGSQPALPPMAYRGSYGTIELTSLVQDAMCRWAHLLTRDLDFTGIIQADWIVDGNAAWLLEINPRWTASMEIIEWALDCNLFLIQASLDDELKPMLTEPIAIPNLTASTKTLYKAIQYANSPFIVSEEQSNEVFASKFNRFNRMNSSCSNRGGWSDIPTAGTAIAIGQPIASYFKWE
jgi:uncharacterized protein